MDQIIKMFRGIEEINLLISLKYFKISIEFLVKIYVRKSFLECHSQYSFFYQTAFGKFKFICTLLFDLSVLPGYLLLVVMLTLQFK